MKQCVKFPDDKFLAVRPCLVAICFGNRAAAKLLGSLLFRYNLRLENKDDAENQNAVKVSKGQTADQDTSVSIYRTQSQLIDDMCGEMTEKTLHDTAVPMLQLLGYLDLEEHMAASRYTINTEQVQEALNLYIPSKKEKQPELEKFLISHMHLEIFLITSEELEKFLNDKKNLLLLLEKVLIQNREISNCKRGRKTSPEAAARRISKRLKNIEEDSKNGNKKEESTSVASATSARDLSDNDTSQQGDINGTNSNLHSDLPSHHGCSHPDHAHLTANPPQKSQQAPLTQGDTHVATTTHPAQLDGSLLDTSYPSLSGMEEDTGRNTTGDAKSRTLDAHLPARSSTREGVTDATSTLPDPDPLPAATATGNHLHRVEDGRAPVQAEAKRSRDEQTPFPVTSPSDGAVGTAPQSSGPRASGRRGKPQQQDVTQATLPPAPSLTEQEQAFWKLWCNVWFNKDIPPKLTGKAQEHISELAPHITTAEQLESLIKQAKQDLEDAQGIKRKTVYLGNLVKSYPGWKQTQKPPSPKPQEVPAQPLPPLRVLPPDRSKSTRFRSPAQTVGRA